MSVITIGREAAALLGLGRGEKGRAVRIIKGTGEDEGSYAIRLADVSDRDILSIFNSGNAKYTYVFYTQIWGCLNLGPSKRLAVRQKKDSKDRLLLIFRDPRYSIEDKNDYDITPVEYPHRTYGQHTRHKWDRRRRSYHARYAGGRSSWRAKRFPEQADGACQVAGSLLDEDR